MRTQHQCNIINSLWSHLLKLEQALFPQLLESDLAVRSLLLMARLHYPGTMSVFPFAR
jgi:hypothetical protein